jgi:hypothetical protein
VPTVRLQSLPIFKPNFRQNRSGADNCLKPCGHHSTTIDYMPQRCRVKLRTSHSGRRDFAIVATRTARSGEAKESVVDGDLRVSSPDGFHRTREIYAELESRFSTRLPNPEIVRGKIPPGPVCHASVWTCCRGATDVAGRHLQELPTVIVWASRTRNHARENEFSVARLNAASRD